MPDVTDQTEGDTPEVETNDETTTPEGEGSTMPEVDRDAIREEIRKEFEADVAAKNKALIENKVEEAISERQRRWKDSQDKLDAENKELKRQLAAKQAEEKNAEIRKLEEEGKTEKAALARAEQLEAENLTLKEQIVGLTRDRVIKDAMMGAEFRTASAERMAFNHIVSQVEKDESNNWHIDGVEVDEYFKQMSKDAEFSYLFKPPENKGSGMKPASATTPGTPDKPSPLNPSGGNSLDDHVKAAAQRMGVSLESVGFGT